MEDLPSIYQKTKNQFPGFIEAYKSLKAAAEDAGPIEKPMIHVILMAASAAMHSESEVYYHAGKALEEGVSIEEIRHATLLLATTIGFPAAMTTMKWINEMVAE
jgi:4-carboxymuconolactone decarboxylase